MAQNVAKGTIEKKKYKHESQYIYKMLNLYP